MILANLVEKERLTRSLSVITHEGVFDIVYDGNGLGYEQILVDGETAKRTISIWWYVPRFEFNIGGQNAIVKVGVSPFLKISKFSLVVGGQTVYSE
ncbi:MAG: hypothetical protein ACR2J3_11705 [Aridibacter sp.]